MQGLVLVGILLAASVAFGQGKTKKAEAKAEVQAVFTLEDGRKVLLRVDGTWEFAPEEPWAEPAPVAEVAPAASRPTIEIEGTVERSYDEFQQVTRVVLKGITLAGYRKLGDAPSHKFHDFRVAAFATSEGSGVAFVDFASTSKESWRYLKCNRFDLLVDGEPMALQDAKHNGKVGSRYVIEHVSLELNSKQLVQIATAKTVRGRICNTTFSLTANQIASFYEFAEQSGALNRPLPAKKE